MNRNWQVWLAASALLAAPAWAAEIAESSPQVETATFSMYCYWTGEAALGRVDGVLASRIGDWRGAEIVQIDYDPQRTDVGELVRALKRQRSFYSVLVGSDVEQRRVARYLDPQEIAVRAGRPRFIESKHSLRTRHPELYALGLSEQQAIALKSWSYFGGEIPDVLSAEQKRSLKRR